MNEITLWDADRVVEEVASHRDPRAMAVEVLKAMAFIPWPIAHSDTCIQYHLSKFVSSSISHSGNASLIEGWAKEYRCDDSFRNFEMLGSDSPVVHGVIEGWSQPVETSIELTFLVIDRIKRFPSFMRGSLSGEWQVLRSCLHDLHGMRALDGLVSSFIPNLLEVMRQTSFGVADIEVVSASLSINNTLKSNSAPVPFSEAEENALRSRFAKLWSTKYRQIDFLCARSFNLMASRPDE